MLYIIFQYLATILHCLLSLFVGCVVLLSNRIDVLIFTFIIMLLVKFNYDYFGRCFLTEYEIQPSSVDFTNNILVKSIHNEKVSNPVLEGICIHIGLLCIIYKILIMQYPLLQEIFTSIELLLINYLHFFIPIIILVECCVLTFVNIKNKEKKTKQKKTNKNL